MATTNTLTVNVGDFQGGDVAGVRVDIELLGETGGKVNYFVIDNSEIIQGGVIATGNTDANGEVTFDLVASTDLQPDAKYRATLFTQGELPKEFYFDFSDSSANLAALLRTTPTPAPNPSALTSVAANSSRFQGDGTSSSELDLVLAQRLPTTTTDGQVIEWDTTTNAWIAVTPTAGTVYSAGTGLELSGSEFSIDTSYDRILPDPSGATDGQVATISSGAWTIAAQTGTTYTAGTNVSISGSNVISATDTNYYPDTFDWDSSSNELTIEFNSFVSDITVDLSSLATDTDTTYTAGTGLGLSGTTFSVTRPLPDPSSSTDGQVLKVDGGAWTIGDDETSSGGAADGVVNSAAFSGTDTITLTLGRSNSLANLTADLDLVAGNLPTGTIVLDPSSATDGQVPKVSSGAWVIGDDEQGSGSGSTDLSLGTRTATTMVIESSSGTNVTLPEADTTNAGLLGSADHDTIAGIATTYAALAGAAFTGEVTVTQTTANPSIEITHTGAENALTISQSQGNHALAITQTGAAQAIMVVQSGDQSPLELQQAEGNSKPALNLITAASGGRKAFQATMTGSNRAWASFEFISGKPGFALGAGTTGAARDTNLYREGTNILRTDDAMTVGDFTTTNRDALTSPPAGTIIWNTTTTQLEVYNGTAWAAV